MHRRLESYLSLAIEKSVMLGSKPPMAFLLSVRCVSRSSILQTEVVAA